MRYLYTTDVAEQLGVNVQRAWRILRDAGIAPLAKVRREGRETGADLLWRAQDVAPELQRRAGKTTRQLRVEANIRRGIERRRAKREVG